MTNQQPAAPPLSAESARDFARRLDEYTPFGMQPLIRERDAAIAAQVRAQTLSECVEMLFAAGKAAQSQKDANEYWRAGYLLRALAQPQPAERQEARDDAERR